MKKFLIMIALILSSLTLNAKDTKMVAVDMNGNKLHVTGTDNGIIIDEYKGKVLFIEYFGHMCPPCMKSIPHYNDLIKKHKDKLAVIAIEAQGYTDTQLQQFVKEKGIDYTVMSASGAGEMYEYISSRAGWRGAIPFLVAVDTKGNVKFIKAGLLSESELEALFGRLSN